MNLVRIKKLKAVENPLYANSNFGDSAEYHYGYFVSDPVIGERFNLYPISNEFSKKGISTSPVVEIKENNIFHTLNSVYQYEFIDKL